MLVERLMMGDEVASAFIASLNERVSIDNACLMGAVR